MSRKKEETHAKTEELKKEQLSETNAEEEPKEAPTEEETTRENPAQKALEEAQVKADEYLALAQRVQADFENYRRRNESIRADAYADGRKDVAAVMLPVLMRSILMILLPWLR